MCHSCGVFSATALVVISPREFPRTGVRLAYLIHANRLNGKDNSQDESFAKAYDRMTGPLRTSALTADKGR
jgi:hypothetical protein